MNEELNISTQSGFTVPYEFDISYLFTIAWYYISPDSLMLLEFEKRFNVYVNSGRCSYTERETPSPSDNNPFRYYENISLNQTVQEIACGVCS